MKNAVNAQVGAPRAGGFIDRLLHAQRRRMFDEFAAFRQGDANDTILNVRMMPTARGDAPDYLFTWADAHARSRILSYEIEAPGSRAAAGDLHLPFRDDSFDWVFCNELIEHIGGYAQQYALVSELHRVARKGVFLTTSNRRHPIEFNTALPFIHWLPDAWWRRILKWSGRTAWASAASFNLVDSATLYRIAAELPGKPKNDVGHKRVFGLKAHFFLMLEKDRGARN